jgi:hypothetical protein
MGVPGALTARSICAEQGHANVDNRQNFRFDFHAWTRHRENQARRWSTAPLNGVICTEFPFD